MKLAVTLIETEIEVFLDLIQGKWGAAWTAMKTGMQAAWADIVGIVEGAVKVIEGTISAITGAIGGAISGIESLLHTGQSAGAQAASTTSQGSSVPKLAAGGIVSGPTLPIVGEAGPEAVVPLEGAAATGAHVSPLPASLGQSGGQQVTIIVNVSGNVAASQQQLANLIGNVFYTRVKMGRVKLAG